MMKSARKGPFEGSRTLSHKRAVKYTVLMVQFHKWLHSFAQKRYMHHRQNHNISNRSPHIPAVAGASAESCAEHLSLSAETHDCSTWLGQGWITRMLTPAGACWQPSAPMALTTKNHFEQCMEICLIDCVYFLAFLYGLYRMLWRFTKRVWNNRLTFMKSIPRECSPAKLESFLAHCKVVSIISHVESTHFVLWI